jgi:hypothetical protein
MSSYFSNKEKSNIKIYKHPHPQDSCKTSKAHPIDLSLSSMGEKSPKSNHTKEVRELLFKKSL